MNTHHTQPSAIVGARRLTQAAIALGLIAALSLSVSRSGALAAESVDAATGQAVTQNPTQQGLVLPAGEKPGVRPITLKSGSIHVFDTAEQHRIRVVVVVTGINHPFALAPLPNGDALVAARGGPLHLVRNAAGAGGKPARLERTTVSGLPERLAANARGGLHDLALHPEFARNRWVYFTFNKPGSPIPPDPAAPHRLESLVSLWRGTLSDDGLALTDVRELLSAEPGPTAGSRLAFGKDGTVYMVTGSAFGDHPQRLDSDYAKVLRVRDDGSIPADNPFVGRPGARPEIFSYGHRDQLGLAVHPVSGAVIAGEFGPNGGDELNLILPGRNYGWPMTSYGRQYTGPRWSALPYAEGTEMPIVVWLPSIAPWGLSFYNGDKFPAWRGNLFVGSAQRGEIPRTGSLERIVFNDQLEELRHETLLAELHQRIADVETGPDGCLYVITDEDDGALLRLEPAN